MKPLAPLLLLLSVLFTMAVHAADEPTPQTATKDAPFLNSLTMKFVPIEITGGPTSGKRVLFSIWQTRVRDFAECARDGAAVWIPEVQRGSNHPVEQVTWNEAEKFCAWLTTKDRSAGKIGTKDFYRLPSDHEWSCAVGIGKLEKADDSPMSKDGKIKVYPWGATWPPPKGYCSFNPSLGTDQNFITSDVGSFPANQNGLFDIIGNAFEWCEDDPFPNQRHDRPKDDLRIVRGSACSTFGAAGFLSSARGTADRDVQAPHLSFRCVLDMSAD
jgi:formylglycine-generating enzyme required for sulfatase activity